MEKLMNALSIIMTNRIGVEIIVKGEKNAGEVS